MGTIASIFALSSCEHKLLCYDHSHVARAEVVFDWSKAEDANPESVSLYLFPEDGGKPLHYEFTDKSGGTIRVPVGKYEALCFNSDTEDIRYRGTERKSSFELYTVETGLMSAMKAVLNVTSPSGPDFGESVASQPETIWSDETDGIEIEQSSTTRIVLAPQLSVIKLSIEFRDVENLKYVAGVSASLSGLAAGLLPGLGYDAVSADCVTIPFEAKFSQDAAAIQYPEPAPAPEEVVIP